MPKTIVRNVSIYVQTCLFYRQSAGCWWSRTGAEASYK